MGKQAEHDEAIEWRLATVEAEARDCTKDRACLREAVAGIGGQQKLTNLLLGGLIMLVLGLKVMDHYESKPARAAAPAQSQSIATR